MKWPGRLKSISGGESYGKGPAMHFWGRAGDAGRKAAWRNWNGRSASRRWRLIFRRGACSTSKSSSNCRPGLEGRCPRANRSKEPEGQGMTVERMCRRAGISRAGFYRFRAREPRLDADVELRDAV